MHWSMELISTNELWFYGVFISLLPFFERKKSNDRRNSEYSRGWYVENSKLTLLTYQPSFSFNSHHCSHSYAFIYTGIEYFHYCLHFSLIVCWKLYWWGLYFLFKRKTNEAKRLQAFSQFITKQLDLKNQRCKAKVSNDDQSILVSQSCCEVVYLTRFCSILWSHFFVEYLTWSKWQLTLLSINVAWDVKNRL